MNQRATKRQPGDPTELGVERFNRVVGDIGPFDMTPGRTAATWADPDGDADLGFADLFLATPKPPTATGN